MSRRFHDCSWLSVLGVTGPGIPALATTLLAGALGITSAEATPTTFTGSYSQNFDVALANGATAMPDGFRAMILSGTNSTYTAANPISTTAIAAATASDTQTLTAWNFGSTVTSSGAALYNIGSGGNLNDRALGSDPTGIGALVIELSLTNATGGNLPGVTFSYDCKCLANGGGATEAGELPGYAFFYSLTGGTNAAEWTAVNALSLPNYTAGTTMSSGPVAITFPTPLTNNGILYFRGRTTTAWRAALIKCSPLTTSASRPSLPRIRLLSRLCGRSRPSS